MKNLEISGATKVPLAKIASKNSTLLPGRSPVCIVENEVFQLTCGQWTHILSSERSLNVISHVMVDENDLLLFTNEDILQYSAGSWNKMDNFPSFRIATKNHSEDLIVILTADELIIVNYQLEVVSSCLLGGDEQRALVNVGWGSRETQFNGKKITDEQKVDQFLEETQDIETQRSPQIVWRGDDEYFALLLPLPENKSQLFIYTQDLVLCNKSEPFICSGGLSWGRWITVGGVPGIINLYETNGLKKSEFSIRKPYSKNLLGWNSANSILAVHVNNEIQLWTTGNFHWYHKLTIPSISAFEWSSTNPLEISTISEEYYSVINLSQVINEYRGTVCVVDSPRLLITPFQKVHVPPPMAFFTYELETSGIKSVQIYGEGSIAVLRDDNVVEFIDCFNNTYKKSSEIMY